MILYCVMFLTLKPPVYDGPDDVTNLNPQTFKTKVLDAEKNKSWLVFFYADWCENCHYYQPMFADLSMRYARKNLSFGKIDVGRYQDIADDFQLIPHPTPLSSCHLWYYSKGAPRNRDCPHLSPMVK